MIEVPAGNDSTAAKYSSYILPVSSSSFQKARHSANSFCAFALLEYTSLPAEFAANALFRAAADSFLMNPAFLAIFAIF